MDPGHMEHALPPGLRMSLTLTVTTPDGATHTSTYPNLVSELTSMAGDTVDTVYDDDEIRSVTRLPNLNKTRHYLTLTLRGLRMLPDPETGHTHTIVTTPPTEEKS